MELTKEEYKTLTKECIEEVLTTRHTCLFTQEELTVLKDFIQFGKMFKQGMFRTMVFSALVLVFLVGYMLYSTFK